MFGDKKKASEIIDCGADMNIPDDMGADYLQNRLHAAFQDDAGEKKYNEQHSEQVKELGGVLAFLNQQEGLTVTIKSLDLRNRRSRRKRPNETGNSFNHYVDYFDSPCITADLSFECTADTKSPTPLVQYEDKEFAMSLYFFNSTDDGRVRMALDIGLCHDCDSYIPASRAGQFFLLDLVAKVVEHRVAKYQMVNAAAGDLTAAFTAQGGDVSAIKRAHAAKLSPQKTPLKFNK